jgi:6-phosphofructokinase 1
MLFKDEVRACGVALGLPHGMVYRQPFPGPGLGVRCLGAITRDRLEAVREADAIVREEIGCKVRSAELSLSQRCAAHLASETDLDESVRIGMSAVSFAVGGISGHMVTACRTSSEPYVLEIGSSDVLQIANQIRAVPSEFINEDGNHVTDACIKFLLPLINGERKIVYDRGIPKHFHF